MEKYKTQNNTNVKPSLNVLKEKSERQLNTKFIKTVISLIKRRRRQRPGQKGTTDSRVEINYHFRPSRTIRCSSAHRAKGAFDISLLDSHSNYNPISTQGSGTIEVSSEVSFCPRRVPRRSSVKVRSRYILGQRRSFPTEFN